MENAKLYKRLKVYLSYLAILAIALTSTVTYIPVVNAATSGIGTVTLIDAGSLEDPGAGGEIYGITGSDFQISIAQPAAVDGGTQFLEYMIFLFPATVSVSTNSEDPNFIGNGSFQPVAQNFTQIGQTTFTLSPHLEQDSGTGSNDPQDFATSNTDYYACVVALADPDSDSLAVCSDPATITFDTPPDTTAPFIDHFPAQKAIINQDAYLYALIDDDQTDETEFDGEIGNGSVQVVYGTDISSSTSTAECTLVEMDFFSCIVPSTSTGSDFEYIIEARDKSDNTRYLTADGFKNLLDDAVLAPFETEVVAAGDNTVSGVISKTDGGGGALMGANVFLGGFAVQSVNSGSDGTYSIPSVVDGIGVDVVTFKDSYCDNVIFKVINTSDVTVNIEMVFGECMFGADDEGPGGGKPHPVFQSPPPNSNFVPLDLNTKDGIRVGFDQELDETTVFDNDPTDSGSNVYLTSDGTTKIAGAVYYCEDDSDPDVSACSQYLFDIDENVILFVPSGALTANTAYTLVIGSGVKSLESNQSIEGNKPGGGHTISFVTGGGGVTLSGENFGTGGQFQPPFITAAVPFPGQTIANNAAVVLRFNDAMDSTTINSTNIQLECNDQDVTGYTVSLDSSSKKYALISSGDGTWDVGSGNTECEISVLGGVKNQSGVTMGPPDNLTMDFFKNHFFISNTSDSSSPSAYEFFEENSTVPVNVGVLEFGFDEALNPSTVTTNNISVTRQTTSVPISVEYDPGINSIFITTDDVLAPNSNYTVTLGTGIMDLAGNSMGASSYSFTTGSVDTLTPLIKKVRCDEFTCAIFFDEPPNIDSSVASNFAASAININNYTLQVETSVGSGVFGSAVSLGSAPTYVARDFMVFINNNGLSAVDLDKKFKLTVSTAVEDRSGNAISSENNAYNGKVENSQDTFGAFQSGVAFPPPTDPSAGGYVPPGVGNFDAAKSLSGTMNFAFPFSIVAGKEVEVFQVNYVPTVAPEDGDFLRFTFPSNMTGFSNAQLDQYSPWQNDINGPAPGVIRLNQSFGSSGLSVNSTSKSITVSLDVVSGTPEANQPLTIDLRGLINPVIPKGPDTSGLTLNIEHARQDGQDTVILNNVETAPWFTVAQGDSTINLNISTALADPVSGSFTLRADGPGLHKDYSVTLTNGMLSSVNGTSASQLSVTGLTSGCYFFHTPPTVSLSGTNYKGQQFPEPVCVGNNETRNKTLSLEEKGASGNSIDLTVKLAGLSDYDGADVDIFASSPVIPDLVSISSLSTPNPSGYTLTFDDDGEAFVGIGPGLSNVSSITTDMFANFPCIPPPPAPIRVKNIETTPVIQVPPFLPPGVTYDSENATLTITCTASDTDVPVRVTDGTSNLSNVEVNLFGNGKSSFGVTGSDGTVTLDATGAGLYDLCVRKPGIGRKCFPLEVKTAGSTPSFFFKGQTYSNITSIPVKLRQPAYLISGKVFDSNNSPRKDAIVHCKNESTGDSVETRSSSDGTYSVGADAGTYSCTSFPKLEEVDMCAPSELTVTVTTANKTNQNLTPTHNTCYTVEGDVLVDEGSGGEGVQNRPGFAVEWDSVNDRPAGGAVPKTFMTDNEGGYEVQLEDNRDYRICVLSEIGEVCEEQSLSGSNLEDADISVAAATIDFDFVGGASDDLAFLKLENASGSFAIEINGLDETYTANVPQGSYTYYLSINNGLRVFEGTVATDATATIDLSSTNFQELTGTVEDDSGNPLTGMHVLATDQDGNTYQTTTDNSGDYEIKLDAVDGPFEVRVTGSGYIPESPSETVDLDTTTEMNFDNENEAAMTPADRVISGTITESGSGGEEFDGEGYVSCMNEDNIAALAPIDQEDGSYDVPVTDGTWECEFVGEGYDKEGFSAPVTVSGSDATGEDLELGDSNADRTDLSSSTTLTTGAGGCYDNRDNTGLKVCYDPGELGSGSENVSLSLEVSFAAPETTGFSPVCDAAFTIEATSSKSIRNLNGDADIEIDMEQFLDIEGCDLPEGVEFSDLKFASFDESANEYNVENGTTDSTNEKVAGQSDHHTVYAVVYSNSVSSSSSSEGDNSSSEGESSSSESSSSSSSSSSSGGGGGGGGGFSTGLFTSKTTSEIATPKALQKVELEEVSSLAENVVDSAAFEVGEDAAVEEEVTLKAENFGDGTAAYVTIKAGTVVKTDDDQPFTGSIDLPKVVEIDAVTPEGKAYAGPVVQVGLEGSGLTFDSPVTVVIPVDLDIEIVAEAEALAVYTLNEETGEWEFLANGTLKTLDGQLVMEFETDHFSKFVVMQDEEALAEAMAEAEAELETEKEAAEEDEEFVYEGPFVDVEDHWAAQFIADLYAMGIVSGYDATHYGPDNQITRAEFTKIAINSFDINVGSGGGVMPFKDVKSEDWFAKFVQAAYVWNIVGGYSDGTFRPNEPINRAEALRILLDAAEISTDTDYVADFPDVKDGDWYAAYVNAAAEMGVISGYKDGTFGPGNNLTRAEVAKIVSLMIEQMSLEAMEELEEDSTVGMALSVWAKSQ